MKAFLFACHDRGVASAAAAARFPTYHAAALAGFVGHVLNSSAAIVQRAGSRHRFKALFSIQRWLPKHDLPYGSRLARTYRDSALFTCWQTCFRRVSCAAGIFSAFAVLPATVFFFFLAFKRALRGHGRTRLGRSSLWLAAGSDRLRMLEGGRTSPRPVALVDNRIQRRGCGAVAFCYADLV